MSAAPISYSSPCRVTLYAKSPPIHSNHLLLHRYALLLKLFLWLLSFYDRMGRPLKPHCIDNPSILSEQDYDVNISRHQSIPFKVEDDHTSVYG